MTERETSPDLSSNDPDELAELARRTWARDPDGAVTAAGYAGLYAGQRGVSASSCPFPSDALATAWLWYHAQALKAQAKRRARGTADLFGRPA
jgi:hypothetical protein